MRTSLTLILIAHWALVGVAIYYSLAILDLHWELVVIGLLAYLAFFMLVIVRAVRHLYHFPIPSFMTQFIDNPFRRRFLQNPDAIAERMGLKPGMIVVEIGPGKGSYTEAVARRILPDGKVFACDISEEVVEKLKERVDEEGITNIIPKIEDAYHFTFADGSIDLIFAIACLPEIPEPVKALKEFRRILKPKGTVCLCELFVDPDFPLRSTEKRWAEEAGLELRHEFGSWMIYQLIFGKKR